MNTKQSWFFRNLANSITWIGILLCVVLLWVVIAHREWISVILFLAALALLTDLVDGPIARYLEKKGYSGSVSSFGGALDRLRDKFFQLTMFSFFLLDPRINPLLKAAIFPLIIIEILLLAIWFLGVRKRMNVSAGLWGKAKMFLVSIGILACPASIMVEENLKIKVPSSATQILFWIFVASLFLAVMSFIKHVAKYRKQLQS